MRRVHRTLTGLGALLLVVILLNVGLPIAGPAPAHRAGSASRLATDIARAGNVSGLHAVSASAPLLLTISLRPPDPAALAARLAQLEDPHSPGYRHYLTESAAVASFAPTVAEVTAVTDYFASFGARGFTCTPDRTAVVFTIPAQGAGSAFGTQLMTGPGPSLRYSSGVPSLPEDLQRIVASVSGLGALPRSSGLAAHPALSSPAHTSSLNWVTDGSGVGEPWFVGSDYTSAYEVDRLWPGNATVPGPTFPNRTAVATILMSGYNATTDQDLPPFDPVVVRAYFNDTLNPGAPQPKILGVPENLSGVPAPGPAYFGALNDSTGNSFENALDLEMAGSAAPGATIANFYFAGSLLASPRFSTTNSQAADDFAQLLADALAYNYSGARLTAISASIGLPDLNDSLWNYELDIAELMGVTVVSASGDQANAPDLWTGRDQGSGTSWPASATFNTTGTLAIGGTTVALDGAPTSVYLDNGSLNVTFDPSVHQVLAQSAWYNTLGGFGNISGTVGGGSQVYAEPYWQLHSAAQPNIVNATVLQGLAQLGRSEPDLAFSANETIAYVARDASGIYFEVLQGTSISAPLFAGMLASASAVSGHPYGFLDPELYRMASYFATFPSAPGDPFLDVTVGANFLFPAIPGWDATTGWGGWSMPAFLAADANGTIRNFTYSGPTPGLPPGLHITLGASITVLLVIVVAALAIAIIIVITVARPRRPTAVARPPDYSYGPSPGSPSSASAPPGGPPWPGAPRGPAFFACPYCGAPRPAEPTRCPSCGQL